MPENFAAASALYHSTSGTAYVDNLRYLVALWTFELDILGRNRHFWLPHQAWFFTSLPSPYDSFRLNPLQRHALQTLSLRLVSLS